MCTGDTLGVDVCWILVGGNSLDVRKPSSLDVLRQEVAQCNVP